MSRGINRLKLPIIHNIIVNDIVEFECIVYPNPYKQTELMKTFLINTFGNQLTKNKKPCLGITKELVEKFINNNEYLAMIICKNTAIDDYATCTIQHYDWCSANSSGSKQLWINDICRFNNTDIPNKLLISPVIGLFNSIEKLSKKYNISENYLFVEPDVASTSKLISIYEKYGFIIDDSCIFTYNDKRQIVMKKSITHDDKKIVNSLLDTISLKTNNKINNTLKNRNNTVKNRNNRNRVTKNNTKN
jgi:hypothetical protein